MLEAIGNNVIVEKLNEDEREVAGIAIPSTSQSLIYKGKITSIGTAKKVKELELSVGDIIIYTALEKDAFSGDNGEELYIVRYDFIQARLK